MGGKRKSYGEVGEERNEDGGKGWGRVPLCGERSMCVKGGKGKQGMETEGRTNGTSMCQGLRLRTSALNVWI